MGATALRIGVTDLLAHPGERRPVTRGVPAGDFGVITTSSAHVPASGTVQLDLVLESILPPSIVVTGTVTFPWQGACRRCLREVTAEGIVEVREIVERRPTDGETYGLRHDTVDLGEIVYDAVLLSLPLAPLCAVDCRGPAPEQFPTTVVGELPETTGDDSTDRPHDPRWAALDQLDFD